MKTQPRKNLGDTPTHPLNPLQIGINVQIDCTILIVTHNINHRAHGAGQHGHAVSAQAGDVRAAGGAADQRSAGCQAVPQRSPIGPIGMSEEKGDAQMAQEQAMVEAGQNEGGVGKSMVCHRRFSPRRACRGGRPSSVTGPGCTRSCTPCRRARWKPSAPTSRARPSIAAATLPDVSPSAS